MNEHTVLCMQDLSAVGRCSLAVAAPVFAAMGIACSPLPLAVLSSHYGGFGAPAHLDATEFAAQALAHYEALGLSFHCVQSGYLASSAQAQLVQRAFAQNPSALKVVDPALGDGGKPYSKVTPDLINAMTALCCEADVIFPNVTESALLLKLTPDLQPFTKAQLFARLQALQARTKAAIVLTGAKLADGTAVNACLSKGGIPTLLPYTATPTAYPGTGDLFAAATTGGLLCGHSLPDSVRAAAAFLSAAAAAMPQNCDSRFGLRYEAFLPLLQKFASEEQRS